MEESGELGAPLLKRPVRVSEVDFIWYKVAAISGM